MKIGTSMKITVSSIGFLAILFIGFFFYRVMTQLLERKSHNKLKRVEQTTVTKRQLSLNQKDRRQRISSQKSLAFSTKDAQFSDEEIDSIIDDIMDWTESSEVTDASLTEEESENDPVNEAKSYDERYDKLVEVRQQMELIDEEITQIQKETRRLYNEIKSKVNDLRNPTEKERLLINEWRKKTWPLIIEGERLSQESAVLLDKVNEVVPGAAVKTKFSSFKGHSGTITYIDYGYIRSELGPLPEELDNYLSQFSNRSTIKGAFP